MTSFIDPLSDTAWGEFISKRADATIFHHPAWLSVLHNQYGLKVFALVWKNREGELTGGLPFCEVKNLRGKTVWISLPFSDHCDVLVDASEDPSELQDALIRLCGEKGIQGIETRTTKPFRSGLAVVQDSVVHTTNLGVGADELFASFKKTQVQQPITKAIRDGLVAEVRDDWKAVDEFFELHVRTRRKLGVPVQPRGFFRILHAQILSKGLGYIVIIKRGSTPIAAGVFCGFGRTLTYKFGASDERELMHRPNNFAIWTAMKEAMRRGFSVFDFGTTEIVHEGLRKFKSGWGSVEVPLYYSFYPVAPSDSKFNFIKNKVVSPVIRHSPTFVCRLTGELFYKYFA